MQTSAAGGNQLLGFLPLILIFVVFYFLLVLPMQKQKKQQKKMLEELKPGDQVLTAGGIVGTIASLDADSLILKTKPSDVKIQFSRSAVSSVLNAPAETK